LVMTTMEKIIGYGASGAGALGDSQNK